MRTLLERMWPTSCQWGRIVAAHCSEAGRTFCPSDWSRTTSKLSIPLSDREPAREPGQTEETNSERKRACPELARDLWELSYSRLSRSDIKFDQAI
jgi:hypothetical protein